MDTGVVTQGSLVVRTKPVVYLPLPLQMCCVERLCDSQKQGLRVAFLFLERKSNLFYLKEEKHRPLTSYPRNRVTKDSEILLEDWCLLWERRGRRKDGDCVPFYDSEGGCIVAFISGWAGVCIGWGTACTSQPKCEGTVVLWLSTTCHASDWSGLGWLLLLLVGLLGPLGRDGGVERPNLKHSRAAATHCWPPNDSIAQLASCGKFGYCLRAYEQMLMSSRVLSITASPPSFFKEEVQRSTGAVTEVVEDLEVHTFIVTR